MSSIIEGYNYDIFISYRQKDNKHDGWVTEFVDNLKGELESTFKEEISVYFDINPHDGLLETHDVDASLKDKLKCLLFIPIISRTYCDPKSFAWEHEFKAFVEQASKDKFGLKVKLPNGNVANRVLPIRIHDLDAADIMECKSVLGGVLRGIDFIYKEPGIDKPLASGDNEKKNLNNTTYRIQIIKVVHAIKEIIQGIKAEPVEIVKEKAQPKESIKEVKEDESRIDSEKPSKVVKSKLLFTLAFIVILIVAGILLYPKIFKRNTLEKLRSTGEKISVAVMPFQNMTNDTIWNVWQDGIQNELITSLTNSEELKVRQTESINNLIQSKGLTNYASITQSMASKISQKLDANVFVYGSIKQAGSIIRLNAQLIDSKTQDVFKSFQIDGIAENILYLIDSLSNKVKNFLIISKFEKEVRYETQKFISTNYPEAYRYFIQGQKTFDKGDYTTTINLLLNSIDIDSNFVAAILYVSIAYEKRGLIEQAKKYCQKAYEKRDMMPLRQKLYVNWLHARFFETPNDEIIYLRELLEIDDQLPFAYYELGNGYNDFLNFEKAIPEYEKALGIYDRWDIKPSWITNYTNLGLAYHQTDQYKKEKELYKKAEQDFPDFSTLIWRQAILALTEGNTKNANEYIEKYISITKDNVASEADISTDLAWIYYGAGILDKAEEYYRQALSLESASPVRMNNLAYFLIDNDRKINESLELINTALTLSPDDYNFQHTKGWALYKQGKYPEALEILQKSWDLRREKAVYNHEAFLHLESAKKAVASQKNN
jgi:tetratricopeptide (TPR) repeat protein